MFKDAWARGANKWMAGMRNKRALNPQGEYLHLSGRGTTLTTKYAWRGSEAQFNNLQPVGEWRLVDADAVYDPDDIGPDTGIENDKLLDPDMDYAL